MASISRGRTKRTCSGSPGSTRTGCSSESRDGRSRPSAGSVDGDEVTVGELTFAVRHCPGHTPGHVVFHHGESKLALVGDVLFKGSVGRWDFPRGDQQQLIRSIVEKLWPMGDETAFVPGHGPMSTFGDERATNPFVGDRVVKA